MKYNASPSEAEVRYLLEKFDQGRNGIINYDSFIKYVNPNGEIDTASIDQLKLRLQRKMREASMSKGGDFDMRTSFEKQEEHRKVHENNRTNSKICYAIAYL